jgi:hypothetical protein
MTTFPGHAASIDTGDGAPWTDEDAIQLSAAYADDAGEATFVDDFDEEFHPPRLADECGFLLLSGAVMAGLWFLSQVHRPSAAAGYAFFFAALALWRFPLALALTFATVPFQQDLGGLPIKMSIAEVNLAMLAPILLLRYQRLAISWQLVIPPLIYLGFCVVATLNRLDANAVKSLIQMALYLILAVGVFAQARQSPRDFYWCFDLLVIVITLFAAIGLATNFRFLGIHKNGWGASISLGLIIAFEMWQTAIDPQRKRWFLFCVGLLTLALMLTVSRGGWLAAMTGVGVLLSLRRDWNTLGRIAIFIVPLVAVGWLLLPEDLQEYAVGFESKRYNIRARWQSVQLAIHAWQQSPWMGTGVGLRKQYDATNVVLLTLAETGILGLGLFALIHANVAAYVWRWHRSLDPSSIFFSVLALGGALVAARLAHGMVDHYWSRGAILAAWASVGMAVSLGRWGEGAIDEG